MKRRALIFETLILKLLVKNIKEVRNNNIYKYTTYSIFLFSEKYMCYYKVD